MNSFGLFAILLALYACLGERFAGVSVAGEPSSLQLRPTLQVDGEGIFLRQLLQSGPGLRSVRLCDAPAFGKTVTLTRTQIVEFATVAGLGEPLTNWTGPEAVKVSRRTRALAEAEALPMLTSVLQQEHVKDKGELELRFSRPWTTLAVPEEPVTLKLLDVPTAGIAPAFILRFELQTERGERLGPWQAAVQARVWREVWVAHSAIKRGEWVRQADLVRERRDMLACHENLAAFETDDPALEFAEPVPAGLPILARSIKARTVVHRGQTVAALLQDGALAITLKLEAMEDGAPGQVIRLRNPVSRRDLHGKVMDSQTILVSL